MPGMAASTSETWSLGAPPNAVEAPEKSFARAVTWACTSMPITTSQSPVAPLISFDFFAGASIVQSCVRLIARWSYALPKPTASGRRHRGPFTQNLMQPLGLGQRAFAKARLAQQTQT